MRQARPSSSRVKWYMPWTDEYIEEFECRVTYGQGQEADSLQAYGLGYHPFDDFLHVLEQPLPQCVFPSSFHDQGDCEHQLQHAGLVVHDSVSTRPSALHETRARGCFDEGEEHLGIAQDFVHVQDGIHDALLLVPDVDEPQRLLLGDGPYRVLVCMQRRLWQGLASERRRWSRGGVVGHDALVLGFVGGGDAHCLEARARDAQIEGVRRRAMEAGMSAGRLGSRARRRPRQHGRVVVLGEGGAGGAIAVQLDVRAQAVQVVEEVVDLLLQTRDVRRHLLELVALLEVVAAIGRIQALETEVAASLARRLPVALDLAPLALVACDADVAVALRPWLRRPVLALPLLLLPRARAVLRAHRVAAVGH